MKSKSNSSTKKTYPAGCLTALLLLILIPVTFTGGMIWIILSQEQIVSLLRVDFWFLMLLYGFGFGVSLLVLQALVSAFARLSDRMKLWAGIAESLQTAALFALLGGFLLALDKYLRFPGLPDLLMAGLLVFLPLWLIRRARPFYTTHGRRRLFWAGATLGLCLSWLYIYIESLGTPLEFITAVLDALGISLSLTLLATLPFRHVPKLPQDHPIGSYFLVTFLLIAYAPLITALRGYWSQNLYLVLILLPLSVAAAAFIYLSQRPHAGEQWGGIGGVLFGGLVIPLILTDSTQMNIMIGANGFNMSYVATMMTLFVVAWLIMLRLAGRQILTITNNRFVPPLAFIGLTTLLILAYLSSGGPLWQPHTFMVIMQNQVDTDFASQITDRDERVTAVYDTLTAYADDSQADIHRFMNINRLSYTPFYLINALEVRGSWWWRWQLSRRDDVAYTLTSPQVRPKRNFNTPWQPREFAPDFAPEGNRPNEGEVTWGVHAIGADEVWFEHNVTGENIVVGIADSGVDWQHEALRDNYRGGENDHDYHWYDPAVGMPTPVDDNGHGTHTAGTVLGRGGIGVAPDANWIACRNLPDNLGNPADYLACMQFLFAPFPVTGDPLTDGDPVRGAHLTNNSWGCPPEEGCDGRTLGIAIHNLYNAGQLMVNANGNSGPACRTTGNPAGDSSMISVGAITSEGTLAEFSSRGPAVDYTGRPVIKPDLVAPGVEIISSYPDNRYQASQGTSMAAPHVTGAAALVMAADPSLIGRPNAVIELLTTTADPIDVSGVPCRTFSENPDPLYGFGFVNVARAASRLVTANEPAE